jgi:predicted amidohydrolase
LGIPALTVNGLAGKSAGGPAGKIGRPVRVVSIGYKGHDKPLEDVVKLVDDEGSRGADVIALGETWRGLNDRGSAETLRGPAVTAMSALAKKNRTYIVCPIDRMDGKDRFNSIVLLDREGRVDCVYNKAFPWFPEFAHTPPVRPGQEVAVYQADFGRLGFAICFDIFFTEVWQQLADHGAELVIYPSDSSGGNLLQAHALNYHYYIVSATHSPDCQVFDITGEEIFYRKGDDLNICRIALDLDRGVYNTDSIESNNGNRIKRDKLLKEHGEDVMQDKYVERDDWFVLKAKRPGVSARELARSYDMEELRDFINRSRLLIDKRRGSQFRAKPCKS